MKLRTKVIVSTALTLLAIFLVVMTSVRLLLIPHFLSAELDDAADRTQRIAGAFEAIELDTINYMARDWAVWDDCYNFMADGNKAFLDANITPTTFHNLRLHTILFVNTSGNLFKGFSYDSDRNQIVAPLPSIQKHLAEIASIPAKNMAHGSLLLPDGLLIFSAQPILTSEEKGPTRGVLVFARFVGGAELTYLSQSLQLPLKLFVPGKNISTNEFTRVSNKSRQGQLVEVVDDNTINGYSVIKDIYGKPAALLARNVPRIIYNNLNRTVNYLLAIIVFSGVLLGLIFQLLLDRLLLLRLSRLAGAITAIGKKEKINLTIPEDGNDEITSLQRAINNTFRSLNQAQAQILRSKELYNIIFENVNDIVFTLNLKGDFVSINRAVERILGYKIDELVGKNFSVLTTPESYAVIKAKIEQKVSGQTTRTRYEAEIKAKDGHIIVMDIDSQIQAEEGIPAAIFGVARDVTERKAYDLQLTSKMEELEQFHSLAVGRELRMTELETEINELLAKLGQKPKY
ncbi:MAG: PAS domain S-box protein [Candidatus Margulisbacteria bacterium]|nr:PAS domain S-box protein [Candidatus Margulisiibacteriota bacterium]MBU1616635.1 PAS domain S-box protein [Candidatus Margulisiibacteriota bacterium]MBU1866974.1 PAS domain S-box protein [Candidatus Margulisiibacteriota bacterium]